MEYLRKNEKIRQTVFVCSYGAQVKLFNQQKLVENPVALSI